MHKYYKILGLQPGADKDAIKKAYRKMAMKYHPDVNPSQDARHRFTEILEAYEYLTGIRKAKRRTTTSREYSTDFYEQMQKMAEERAKAKYRERVRQFRKKMEEQQNREYQKGIIIFIGVILVALGSWQGYKFYKGLVISSDRVVAQAEVIGLATNRVIYQFPVGDSLYLDREYVSRQGISMLADNGLPLKTGDIFEVTYNREKPSFHEINYEKVSPLTMRRYLEMVSLKFQYIYQDEWVNLTQSEKNIRSLCMTLLVFEEYKFEGLSKVYYHDVHFLENLSHNRLSWYFMKRKDKFAEIKASCKTDTIFNSGQSMHSY